MNSKELDAHDVYYHKYSRESHPATGVDLNQALFEAADLGFTAIPLESEMRDFTLALWERGFAIVGLDLNRNVQSGQENGTDPYLQCR